MSFFRKFRQIEIAAKGNLVMSIKNWKKIVLGTAVLGVLLVGCGCMCLFHPDHCGGEQGHASTTAPGSFAHEEGVAAAANLSTLGAETHSGPSFASHHGLAAPRSPWTWLAGGGMVLMMVLMVF